MKQALIDLKILESDIKSIEGPSHGIPCIVHLNIGGGPIYIAAQGLADTLLEWWAKKNKKKSFFKK